MPTVDLPAMRSIRMLSAFSARHRSSVRLVMRLYLIPASGLNSKVVTTGPGLIWVICPCTSNSAYFPVNTWASSFSSSASMACCSSGRCSRELGGSLKPPAAMRGKVADFGGNCMWLRPGFRDRLVRVLFRKSSVDTGPNWLGNPRLRLNGRRCRPRWNHLRGDDWLRRSPAFFKFLLHALLGASIPPIFCTIPKRNRESEPGRRPKLQCGKRKRGREIQRHRQNAGANDISSREVEVVDEKIPDHSAK